MKTLHKNRLLGLVVGLACYLLPTADTAAQGYISFQTFYHELAPYGSWVHNPQHGQVWIPNVGSRFQPYVTRGHWVMTDYGNTWVSDYNWGWAAFHYGRWYLDDYHGWAWVPGHEWGPAWVAWRSGGDYYGWAPLSPGLNVNVSINIGRRIPRNYWAFVPRRYITSPRIYDYCVPRRRVVNVFQRTTIINNTYVYNDRQRYYSGPRVREIERVTHRRVPVRSVRTANRARPARVQRGSVAMYRPQVRASRNRSSVAPRTYQAQSSGVNNRTRGTNTTRGRATVRTSPDRSSYDRRSSVRSEASRSRQPASSTRSQRLNRQPSATAPTDRSYGASSRRSSQMTAPARPQRSDKSSSRARSGSTTSSRRPASVSPRTSRSSSANRSRRSSAGAQRSSTSARSGRSSSVSRPSRSSSGVQRSRSSSGSRSTKASQPRSSSSDRSARSSTGRSRSSRGQ